MATATPEKQPLVEDSYLDDPSSPPTSTAMKLPLSTLEALHTPPSVPLWIERLPFTIPLTHAALAIPATLLGATTLREAILLSSAVSFVLVAGATARVARATRRDERAANIGLRRLALAAGVSLIWPLLVALWVLCSGAARRNCSKRITPTAASVAVQTDGEGAQPVVYSSNGAHTLVITDDTVLEVEVITVDDASLSLSKQRNTMSNTAAPEPPLENGQL